MRLAGFCVNVVDACRGDLDEAQIGQLCEDFTRHQHLVGDGNLRALQAGDDCCRIVCGGFKHLPVRHTGGDRQFNGW